MVNKKEKKTKPSSVDKKKSAVHLVDLVVKGMQEKKGHSITIIDLRNIKSAVADYFVLCSANTDNQLDAIRHSVEEEVWKASGQDVWMKEGIQNKEWILLDYADVVAHIFRTDRREFYGLEELWGDADIITIDDDTAVATKKPKKEVKSKIDKTTSKKAATKKVAKMPVKSSAVKNNKKVAKASTPKKKSSK